MTFGRAVLTGLAMLAPLCLPLHAQAGTPDPAGHRVMVEIGTIPPPDGWLAFCADLPGECRSVARSRPVTLDERRWKELELVNRRVNETVRYVEDGDEDIWLLPTDQGDCEDFVLLKRKRLAQRGWPLGALLITVVVDRDGRGHSLLTVRTDRGEFVLDSNTTRILEWSEAPYTFMSRQSSANPNTWAALER